MHQLLSLLFALNWVVWSSLSLPRNLSLFVSLPSFPSSQDSLPIRRAKITQEAAERKVEKELKAKQALTAKAEGEKVKAEAATAAVNDKAKAAADARAASETQLQKAEEARSAAVAAATAASAAAKDAADKAAIAAQARQDAEAAADRAQQARVAMEAQAAACSCVLLCCFCILAFSSRLFLSAYDSWIVRFLVFFSFCSVRHPCLYHEFCVSAPLFCDRWWVLW